MELTFFLNLKQPANSLDYLYIIYNCKIDLNIFISV